MTLDEKVVTVPVKASDLEYWDSESGKWVLEPGKIDFFVGSSSSDIKLKGSLSVNPRQTDLF